MDFFSGVLKLFGVEEGPHFSKAEIARHHTRNSLWLIADKKVYDVTQFVDQHAGGAQSILKRGGGCEDCSRDFGFHSSKAQDLWKSFQIGYVADGKGAAGKTDEAGRNFLRSRGFVPVEDLKTADQRLHCTGPNCAFHFEGQNNSTSTTIGKEDPSLQQNVTTSASVPNAGKAPLQQT